MLKLRHREGNSQGHTVRTWQSWDVNLGSLISETVLLASTLWSCFHTWLFDFSLLLSTSDEQLFALILLILHLFFFWYLLLASAFYLYPWNLSLHGHHWYFSVSVSLWSISSFWCWYSFIWNSSLDFCDAGFLLTSLSLFGFLHSLPIAISWSEFGLQWVIQEAI